MTSLRAPKGELAPVTLAPDWTHLVIGCSLSPRSKKQLASSVQGLSIKGLRPLSLDQLFVPLLDLGLCHRDVTPLLSAILKVTAVDHGAFKLFAERVAFLPLKEPIGAGAQLVTMKLKDRHDQLLLIREELARRVTAKGFELPLAREGHSGRMGRFVDVLMGVSESDQASSRADVRASVWVNDLILLSRPHKYQPGRGYQIEREEKLLTEPPSTQLTKEESATARLERHELRLNELCQKLDQRLEERAQAYKEHTVSRVSEPNPTEPKRRRRRRKRSKST